MSRITLLVGDEKVEYVSGVVDELASSTGEPFARIVVLSENRLIESFVLLHGGSREDYEPQVTVVPRSALETIQTFGVHSLFDTSVDAPEWPGAFQLALSYRGRPQAVVVPVGRSTVRNGKALFEVLPALLSDLAT